MSLSHFPNRKARSESREKVVMVHRVVVPRAAQKLIYRVF